MYIVSIRCRNVCLSLVISFFLLLDISKTLISYYFSVENLITLQFTEDC